LEDTLQLDRAELSRVGFVQAAPKTQLATMDEGCDGRLPGNANGDRPRILATLIIPVERDQVKVKVIPEPRDPGAAQALPRLVTTE
jgi:hypothetical protein